MNFRDVALLPGVLLLFEWSDRGELVATSNRQAAELSDGFAACAEAAAGIAGAPFGSLVELHINCENQNGVLFMSTAGAGGHSTIGATLAPSLEPHRFIEYLREATP